MADVLRKRYYYGRSIPAFAERHDGAVAAQGKAVLDSYVRNRGTLLRDPLHAVGMVALRGLEASVILVGVVAVLPAVARPATTAAPGLSVDVVDREGTTIFRPRSLEPLAADDGT